MDSALSSLSRNYWHWQEIEARALVGASGALFIEYRVGCLCRGQICGLNHPQRRTSDGSRFTLVLFVTFSPCVWFMPRCVCYCCTFCPDIFVLFPLICRDPLTFHSKTFNFSIATVLFFSFFHRSKKMKCRRPFYWASLGRIFNYCQLLTKPLP